MSNPFKPTPRVLALLGAAEHGGIMGTRYERHPGRGFWHLVRPSSVEFRTPSEKEVRHLLTFDLCEERDNPNCCVRETSTNKIVGRGVRLYLKPIGARLLKESRSAR